MLRHVLKYDLKHLYKFLLPLYAIILLIAIAARCCQLFEGSFLDTMIGPVVAGMAFGCAIGALTNNTVRCWLYFRSNLYGDEGYLTNTLPLNKSTIYLAKLTMSIITLLTSSLLLIATILIVFGSAEDFARIWEYVAEFAAPLQISTATMFIILAALFLLELFCVVGVGFFGIILGQRARNAKGLLAVIFGTIAFFSVQALLVATIFVVALFQPDLMGIFTGNGEAVISATKTTLLIGVIFYPVVIGVFSFINIKMLDRGVNLE